MKWISNFRRRRAIKRYARILGPLLKRRYGNSNTYTVGQIKNTAEQAKLPMAYICFGYAMYMSQDEFEKLHVSLGQRCDYGAMRQEVADLCFSGNSDFSTEAAIAYGEDAGGVFDFPGGTDVDPGGDALR